MTDSRSSSVLSSAISHGTSATFTSSFSSSAPGGYSLGSRRGGAAAEIVLDAETTDVIGAFAGMRPLHALSRLRILHELTLRNSGIDANGDEGSGNSSSGGSPPSGSPFSRGRSFTMASSPLKKQQQQKAGSGAAGGMLPPQPAMDRILYQSGGTGSSGGGGGSSSSDSFRAKSPSLSSSPTTTRLPAALAAAAASSTSAGRSKQEAAAKNNNSQSDAMRPGRIRRVTDWYLQRKAQERIAEQKSQQEKRDRELEQQRLVDLEKRRREQQQEFDKQQLQQQQQKTREENSSRSPDSGNLLLVGDGSAAATPRGGTTTTLAREASMDSIASSPIAPAPSSAFGASADGGVDGCGVKSAATIRLQLMAKAAAKQRKDASGHIVYFSALRSVFRIAPRQSGSRPLGGLALLALVCAEHGDAVIATAAVRLAPGSVFSNVVTALAFAEEEDEDEQTQRRLAVLADNVESEKKIHDERAALVAQVAAVAMQSGGVKLSSAMQQQVAAAMSRRNRSSTTIVASPASLRSSLLGGHANDDDAAAAALAALSRNEHHSVSSASFGSTPELFAAASSLLPQHHQKNQQDRPVEDDDIFGFGHLSQQQEAKRAAAKHANEMSEQEQYTRARVPGRAHAPQHAAFRFRASTANSLYPPGHFCGCESNHQSSPQMLAANTHTCDETELESRPGFREPVNAERLRFRKFLSSSVVPLDPLATNSSSAADKKKAQKEMDHDAELLLDTATTVADSSSSSSSSSAPSPFSNLYNKVAQTAFQKRYVLLCCIFGVHPNKTFLKQQLGKFRSPLEVDALSFAGNLIGDRGLLPVLEMSRLIHHLEANQDESSSSSSCRCYSPFPNFKSLLLPSSGITDVGAECVAEWIMQRFIEKKKTAATTTWTPCGWLDKSTSGVSLPTLTVDLTNNPDIGIAGGLALLRALVTIRRVCSSRTRWWKQFETNSDDDEDQQGDDFEAYFSNGGCGDELAEIADQLLTRQASTLMVSPSSANLLKSQLQKNPFSLEELMKLRQQKSFAGAGALAGLAASQRGSRFFGGSSANVLAGAAENDEDKAAQELLAEQEFLQELTDEETNFFTLKPQKSRSAASMTRTRSMFVTSQQQQQQQSPSPLQQQASSRFGEIDKTESFAGGGGGNSPVKRRATLMQPEAAAATSSNKNKNNDGDDDDSPRGSRRMLMNLQLSDVENVASPLLGAEAGENSSSACLIRTKTPFVFIDTRGTNVPLGLARRIVELGTL